MKKIGLLLAVFGLAFSLVGAEAKMLRIPLGRVFGQRATRRRRVKKRITFHVVKVRIHPFYRRQAENPKTCHRAAF